MYTVQSKGFSVTVEQFATGMPKRKTNRNRQAQSVVVQSVTTMPKFENNLECRYLLAGQRVKRRLR